MKKIFIIILVIIISIVYAIGSYAESDTRIELADSMQDYAAEKLEQLLEMYKNDQSSFSKEYLYLTYSYYNMWIAMEKVGNAEKALQSSTGAFPLWAISLASEKQIHDFNKAAITDFGDWLDGNLSDEEFCLYFMIRVEAVIEMNNNRK